jgi:hypothetical protein
MKRSKRTLTRLLDKEVSRVVRMRGSCVKCGQQDNLQAAHIYSRNNRAVRWDLDNVICLCAGDHFAAHASPVQFTLFVRDYLGEYRFNALNAKAKNIKKWKLWELEELLTTLKGVR